MTRRSIHRRSPLISTLIFIIVIAASLLLITLLRLDIGTYKQQLANQLERTLNKPVKLGDAALSFHGGIALDFRNLRIGDDNIFSLQVPQLTAILNPYDLLRGEIIIEQVLLEYPSLKLETPINLTHSDIDLDRLGLKTLQIRKGSLVIYHPDTAEKPLRVENFNLVLHGLGKGLVSQLATTATLFQNNRNAELKAFLELKRQRTGQPWRQANLRGDISLNHLRNRTLESWDFENLPQMFDITLGVKGVPAQKVVLNAVLKDSNDTEPLLSVTSEWQSTEYLDRFQNLKLGMAGIPLSGDLQFDRRNKEPRLSGQIKLGTTNIATLMVATHQHPLKNLTGEVAGMILKFDGPLRPTDENPFSPLRTAKLRLNKLNYPARAFDLSETQLNLKLLNGRLDLNSGHGKIAGIPFSVSGHSDSLDRDIPEIELKLNAEANLSQIQHRLSAPFWKKQHLSGTAPLQLSLQGPINHIRADLSADLTSCKLLISKLIDKKSKQLLKLDLHGDIKPQQLILQEARVQLDGQPLVTTGELTLKNNKWAGTLLLETFETSSLQKFSPIFEHFRIAGKLRGRVELSSKSGIAAHFSLIEGGAHLTQLLGDLNQVQANISLNDQGIDLGQVKARLGGSAITVSGALDNWRSPLLSLHVTGKKIRANDLIFTNRKMTLQDLDGQIMINSGGILFDRVAVTIENKTHALIHGQMRSYRNPQTYLEVDADKAEILDIIRLFQGPPRPVRPHGNDFSPSLILKAKLAKGTIDGLAFTDASGTVFDRHQIFTVEPLTLKIGEGKARGRVEFEPNRNHLLKISGRIDNLDVEQLHQNFFKKHGIFLGSISGDFYVEGENHDGRFWKTSRGGGHFEVWDGTLKKLHGLAQIFSILNITQLFTFSLPDIDKEGMPFSKLSISPRLEKGIYRFDNMQIISPAMNISAVGQLDMLHETIDATVGVKPLRTVDILLEKIPLIGWILTGKEKALITALFTLKGPINDSKVAAVPVSTVSDTVLGIIGRTLTLPAKLLQDTETMLSTPPRPDDKGTIPEQNSEH